MTRFFEGIDWSLPWYASIASCATELMDAQDWRQVINARAVAQAMCNYQQQSIRFVEQAMLPEGMAYEAFIHATGQVPTRENLHDFFNSLVWLTFPKIKAQLNALQAAQIASMGIGKSRGAARDAATIFDENATLLVVADNVEGHALVSDLREHRWQQAFVEKRQLFGASCEVWSFGHALMEKLVQPYKAITAHAWVHLVAPEFFSLSTDEKRALLDSSVASQLGQVELTTAAYTPLPVLGIPHWWPLQNAEFYADTSVFRAKRISKK